MVERPNAPIVVKRKKVVAGGGHHGGAWKVAYADFVTAMMAFFLLMWLLNATTEQQKKGIADYFAPMIPLSRVSGGSDGMFGGDSPTSIDSQPSDGTATSFGIAGEAQYPEHDTTAGTAAAEVAALRDLEETLLGRGGESTISEQAMRHVVTRLTDEGLIIEIFALPDAPIFVGETAEPTPVTRELVAMIARLSSIVVNPVAVAGHVRPRPVIVANPEVWDLTSDQANAVRRLLEDGGLDLTRVARVTGHGDRAPIEANPTDLRNDRIEITLLRLDY
jgi:chemotaxis protein MotB